MTDQEIFRLHSENQKATRDLERILSERMDGHGKKIVAIDTQATANMYLLQEVRKDVKAIIPRMAAITGGIAVIAWIVEVIRK